MQTYIPSGDWRECAKVLGREELIVSLKGAVNILQVLHEHGNPGKLKQLARHPMVEMWRQYDAILAVYGITLLEELTDRGAEKVMRGAIPSSTPWNEGIQKALGDHLSWAMSGSYSMDKPKWASDEAFIASQRALLVRVDPVLYGPMWPDVDASLPERWPIDA